MRKLTVLAALLLAGCAAAPPAVIGTTANSVTIEQAGGTSTPDATVAAAADKGCRAAGKLSQFGAATKAPDGKMQYLYFCH